MSERLPSVSGKQLVKVLERRGWYVKRIRGSHHILRHPEIPDEMVRLDADGGIAMRDKDFLDEIVDERTAQNPGFPQLVDAAVARRRVERLIEEREQEVRDAWHRHFRR